jgi:hypothetical protein
MVMIESIRVAAWDFTWYLARTDEHAAKLGISYLGITRGIESCAFGLVTI